MNMSLRLRDRTCNEQTVHFKSRFKCLNEFQIEKFLLQLANNLRYYTNPQSKCILNQNCNLCTSLKICQTWKHLYHFDFLIFEPSWLNWINFETDYLFMLYKPNMILIYLHLTYYEPMNQDYPTESTIISRLLNFWVSLTIWCYRLPQTWLKNPNTT